MKSFIKIFHIYLGIYTLQFNIYISAKKKKKEMLFVCLDIIKQKKLITGNSYQNTYKNYEKRKLTKAN